MLLSSSYSIWLSPFSWNSWKLGNHDFYVHAFHDAFSHEHHVVPLGFFTIGIFFTVWAWITLKDIEAGKYGEAKTYSLMLGIIGLFFAWLLGDIFFLLAYTKLGK